MRRSVLGIGFCAGLAGLLALGAAARAEEGWGTLKGRVEWAGGAVPQRAKLNVNKDQEACLKNGPLLSEEYVVNPKNKGVRWVFVWLVDPKDPKKPVPVKPELKQPAKKVVEMDQPCCMFEPHLVGLQEGQTLVVKNSATVAHNVNVIGGPLGPNTNPILPAGQKFTLEGIVGRPTPIQVSCNIHPWMKAYVRVFKNPYFAVTDEDGNFEIKGAPAGNYNLVVWQESTGWVAGAPTPNKNGMPIAIKPNAVTDLGAIPLKPS